MIGYSTVTQKGQITIPAEIRRELNLLPKRQVIILAENDGAKVKLVPDVTTLRGSIKINKKFDINAMRKSAMHLVAQRHLKTKSHAETA